jgi:hypothetical protein
MPSMVATSSRVGGASPAYVLRPFGEMLTTMICLLCRCLSCLRARAVAT